MKKRYKGYFKKATNLSDSDVRRYIEMKTDKKFRLRLWVKIYLRDIKINVLN